jgi:DNA-binding MarR family transcriptional regulator
VASVRDRLRCVKNGPFWDDAITTAADQYVSPAFVVTKHGENHKPWLDNYCLNRHSPSVARKLKDELKQTKPFAGLEEEVILNLVRTAEYVLSRGAEVLKRESLTSTQYNALRILRGAGAAGLPCGEIGERMVTKESDITRLLDRLERRGLITRERPESNRRVVITRISDAGLRILADLDGPVQESHRRVAGHLGPERLDALNELLEATRTLPPAARSRRFATRACSSSRAASAITTCGASVPRASIRRASSTHGSRTRSAGRSASRATRGFGPGSRPRRRGRRTRRKII